MINDKKTLTVSILGKNYSLVTDENNDVVELAAQSVESLLKQVIHSATSPAEAAKKTTFVALQIAVDLIKQKAEHRILQSDLVQIDNKVTTLSSLLREQLNN